MIKYIKSVLWRVAKCLSYIEEARCLKVKWKDKTASSYGRSQVLLARLAWYSSRVKFFVFWSPMAFSQGQVPQQYLCFYVQSLVAYWDCPNWRAIGKCSRGCLHGQCSRNNVTSRRYVATDCKKNTKLRPALLFQYWYGKTSKYTMLF